jgi:DNA-binding transcriptional ArsR family regulator
MTSDKTPTAIDEEPDTDPAEAFGALSDPLRVDILQTLGEYHRETRTRNLSASQISADVSVWMIPGGFATT